jgi:hypothetical protein
MLMEELIIIMFNVPYDICQLWHFSLEVMSIFMASVRYYDISNEKT